jgi:hypothetical protein
MFECLTEGSDRVKTALERPIKARDIKDYLKVANLQQTILLVSWLTFALSAFGEGTLKWKEDVLLSNGKVLTVERVQEFKGPHEIGQAPTESNQTFEFASPSSGQRIRWRGYRSLTPIALLEVSNELYLLLQPQYDAWRSIRCPEPMYQVYHLQGSQWHWEPLQQLPLRKLKANLAVSPSAWRRRITDLGGHIPVSEPRNERPGSGPLEIDLNEMREQVFVSGGPYRLDEKWVGPSPGFISDVACLNSKPKTWATK